MYFCYLLVIIEDIWDISDVEPFFQPSVISGDYAME